MTTYLKKQEVEFKDPSTGEVLSVLEELETPGTEFLNITLKDDEGWKLDVYENGFVEFYELNYDKRVIGKNVSHERVIQMWRMMAEGKRDQVKKLLKKKPSDLCTGCLYCVDGWELNDARADLNALKPHFKLLRAGAVFHGYFFGDTTIIN